MGPIYVPPEDLIVRITAPAYWAIVTTVGSKPPESGGLLLGPSATDEVTEFWFDPHSRSSSTTYSPDTVAMNRLLREEWRPRGLDWKGFVHSHPRGFEELTSGDVDYIERLLASSKDMKRFVAPVLMPESYSMRTFVVLAERPRVPLAAQLHLM